MTTESAGTQMVVKIISAEYYKDSHSLNLLYIIGQRKSVLECKLPPTYMYVESLRTFILRGLNFVYGHNIIVKFSPGAEQQLFDICISSDYIWRTLA
ncbi:MAG: hypothetical protein ACP5NC_06260 [Nitrososphaeria archaeon]